MIEQPLTIYFDLSPDARPTIGAVGKAMVEFEKMAGEAVFLMEPGTEFSFVYQYSGTGSLRIVTSLRGYVTRERLKKLAYAISVVLASNTYAFVHGMGMEELVKQVVGEEEASTLSEEDIQRIAEAVHGFERSQTVTEPRREFYRAVDDDPSITGVAIAPNDQEERPNLIVPREEFTAQTGMTGATSLEQVTETERVSSRRVEVVLANAPLIESRAKWRVYSDGHQISAKMLDDDFKQRFLEGTTDLKLAGGVILEVTLEVTQSFQDGVWQNKSFAIIEVHSWRQNSEQAEMLLSHTGDNDDENEQSAE